MTQNIKSIKKPTQPDLWSLYWNMLRSRLFELEVTRLWQEGLIPGEMSRAFGIKNASNGIGAKFRASKGILNAGDAADFDVGYKRLCRHLPLP